MVKNVKISKSKKPRLVDDLSIFDDPDQLEMELAEMEAELSEEDKKLRMGHIPANNNKELWEKIRAKGEREAIEQWKQMHEREIERDSQILVMKGLGYLIKLWFSLKLKSWRLIMSGRLQTPLKLKKSE
jgi:hypothetical protein